MFKLFNMVIFLTMYLVALTWSIYVPEHTKNIREFNREDYALHTKNRSIKENKPLQLDLQKNGNKKQLKLSNNVEDNYVGNDGQQSLISAKHTKTIEQQQLLLNIATPQKSCDIDDDVVNARNCTSKNEHKNLEKQLTGLVVQQQQYEYNNDIKIIENKNDNNDPLHTLSHTRQRRQLSDFLIAPNTRWCGRGNTANGTYNHLGGASIADKCCRTHDHCKMYIPAMSNRFDLFNYRPYTLSHCNCDRRFRTCLKMANDEDANTIGKLFFNLVQTQCFVLAKEVICQQRSSNGTCFNEYIKQKAYLRSNKKY